MAKAGGKGRISNGLVAASCAAVMAVYAAGYWRTRDEARRIDVRAQERRPPRSATPATSPAEVVYPATALPATPSAPALATTPASPVGIATSSTTTGTTPAGTPPQPVAVVATAAGTAASPAAQATAPSQIPALPSATPEASTSPLAAAQPAPAPAPAAAPSPSGNWRDGTFTGWGTSRHGDIKAQVVIREGRIVEAAIASCETRYPCDVIGDIIAQPVARQSPEVDRVSRATESADAYYYGLVEALKEAQVADAAAPAPR